MQGGVFRVGNDGDIDASAISSGPREKGYRVDVDGNIDFPILGKLHVEGLKVSEVTNLIRERIIAGNYIKRIDRVAVIREIGGERKMFMHDLRSMDIFDSPCYYLQQNDIVYVEPKYRKKDNEDRGWQIGTTLLSVVTAVCSILWAIK